MATERKTQSGLPVPKVKYELDLKPDETLPRKPPKSCDVDTKCGIGACTPHSLQRCANIASFTATAGMVSLFLQTLSTYISTQITTLEKQFGLSSTDSGFLVSCNDIGFLSTVLFTSHFGRKGHIPRILAVAAIIYGIAGIACSLSQLIEPMSLPSGISGSNSSSDDGEEYLCTQKGSTTRQNETYSVADTHSSGSSQWVIYIIATSLIVQGMCKSPKTPLSALYIDNNVSDQKKTGLFLGVITTLTLFGPALSFAVGGVFSRIPVDLKDTLLTQTDPRWIGAWWLGFLVFGSIAVVLALPLFFYPRRMKTSWKETETEADDHEHKEESLCEKIKDMPASVLRVLRNPIYTCSLCGITCINFTVGGYVAFGPKYMETVFTIPSWQANVMLGVQAAVSLGLGTFLGGFLTSRFRLNPQGCLKFVVGACTVAVTLEALNFIFGCENTKINGLSMMSGNATADCDCEGVRFLPVCGAVSGETYFSPCHAGCRVQNETAYVDCSMESEGGVTPGQCDSGCPFLYPYIITTVVYGLVGTLTIIPAYIIMLRTVRDDDKAMAIGILSFTISLLGFFPAPIVYGKVIDTTCKLWNFTRGARGSCAVYDIVDLRMKMIGMNVGLRTTACCVFVIAFLIARFEMKQSELSGNNETINTRL
ncbi:solute carrier organic anion transporter family member 2B1-like [Haliotis rufescens]|uniref:solute carrier organic anion transporter family member 2B1-like n=1 Tax=Haliotis rufescens TaxID=6454 RepID=UPI00201ECE17|nr:solute carrier organic anion transporter family member 2B1-like [Haliotis rufescens]XP_048257225.1 solute carrier organic anion transporter family member 2B1-like [Haliotis rufescens]XP_048257227.1 solute carrier organic anion transporter family member 2B1-like [Haliotis rufescens]